MREGENPEVEKSQAEVSSEMGVRIKEEPPIVW